jgi:hypothetical protein
MYWYHLRIWFTVLIARWKAGNYLDIVLELKWCLRFFFDRVGLHQPEQLYVQPFGAPYGTTIRELFRLLTFS